MKDERRYGARIPMRLLVKARYGGVSHPLYTQNIALEGLFITTPDPPARHTLTYLELTLPGDDARTRLHAMVVRSNSAEFAAENALVPGMGVQLYGLGEATRRTWVSFIERIHEEFLDHYEIWAPQVADDKRSKNDGPTPIPGRTTPLPDREWTSLPSGLLTPVMQRLPTPVRNERGLRLPRKTLRAYYGALAESRPATSRPVLLFRISPVDAGGVSRFYEEALTPGEFRAECGLAPPEGSVVVVALVHPFTEAEAHFPCRISERRGDEVKYRFIGMTKKILDDYAHFVDTGTPPETKEATPARSIFEDAHEAQPDVIAGSRGVIALESFSRI